MKHLKKFESFSSRELNENNKPGPNIEGSVKVSIKEEEVSLFADEPVLQKLIADDKVSLIGNTVYYKDDEVRKVLDQYLEI